MPNPVSDLLNAIAYERFFLEQVYRLTVDNGRPAVDIELAYAANGEPGRQGFRRSYLDLGDWRSGFIAAGTPLIFTTTFKVLDSVFEWLIKTPTKAPPNQIEHKLDALKKLPTDSLPELFKSEPWLFERLVALYRRTAQLRNTLIHRGEFEVTTSGLRVQPGKAQPANERTAISNTEVASFAVLMLNVLRLIAGISTIDVLSRKRVRWLFDRLVSLHEQASLGQEPIQFGRVNLAFSKGQDVAFDLSRLRQDISPAMPVADAKGNTAILNYDTVFDIHIAMSDVTGVTEQYLIPYNDMDRFPAGISSEQLLAYKLSPAQTGGSTQ